MSGRPGLPLGIRIRAKDIRGPERCQDDGEGAEAATTSHVKCTAEEREAMGIPEGLVRYSVGIEDTNELTADLERALKLA